MKIIHKRLIFVLVSVSFLFAGSLFFINSNSETLASSPVIPTEEPPPGFYRAGECTFESSENPYSQRLYRLLKMIDELLATINGEYGSKSTNLDSIKSSHEYLIKMRAEILKMLKEIEPSAIRVLEPERDDVFEIGKKHDIKWSSPRSRAVKIDVCKEKRNETFCKTINRRTTSGGLSWLVDGSGITSVTGSDWIVGPARIRITDLSTKQCFESDSFLIKDFIVEEMPVFRCMIDVIMADYYERERIGICELFDPEVTMSCGDVYTHITSSGCVVDYLKGRGWFLAEMPVQTRPYITHISPVFGKGEDRIAIFGRNLNATRPLGLKVEFLRNNQVMGSQDITAATSTGTLASFNLSGILAANIEGGKYKLRVRNDHGNSNLVDFEIIGERRLSTISVNYPNGYRDSLEAGKRYEINWNHTLMPGSSSNQRHTVRIELLNDDCSMHPYVIERAHIYPSSFVSPVFASGVYSWLVPRNLFDMFSDEPCTKRNKNGWYSGDNFKIRVSEVIQQDESSALLGAVGITPVSFTIFDRGNGIPPSISLIINGSTRSSISVNRGEPVNIEWNAKDATHCSFSGGLWGAPNIEPSGIERFRSGFDSSGKIIIACFGPGGSSKKEVDLVLLSGGVSGKINCSSTTDNSIVLDYNTQEENNRHRDLSVWRNNTKISPPAGASMIYSGRVTDTGLSPSTSYTYSLRLGQNITSPLIDQIGCRTSQPEKKLTAKIKNVAGVNTFHYPEESILVSVEGVMSNGLVANPGDGFHVQAYIYRVGSDGRNIETVQGVNATYNTRRGSWEAKMSAPKNTGSYNLDVALYCSNNYGKCDPYGVSSQDARSIDFSVSPMKVNMINTILEMLRASLTTGQALR